jgi:phosphoglycolate phosphatase-like HAD superfamily hydrolase
VVDTRPLLRARQWKLHEHRLWQNDSMNVAEPGLVVWDVDGTLVPADLRWLRRAIARTYNLAESSVIFPSARVHGYTDESIVLDTATGSGIAPELAAAGIPRFHEELDRVMAEGHEELLRDQAPYPGASETLEALHRAGFVQTVLTGNLRSAAEVKLGLTGLDRHLDLTIGGFGSDSRDRFALPALIAERFAAQYGRPLEPKHTVVIGDAPNDIACARHAGFHVIAVAHRMEAPDLERHHPDVVLGRLEPSLVVDAVNSLVGAGHPSDDLSHRDQGDEQYGGGIKT